MKRLILIVIALGISAFAVLLFTYINQQKPSKTGYPQDVKVLDYNIDSGVPNCYVLKTTGEKVPFSCMDITVGDRMIIK